MMNAHEPYAREVTINACKLCNPLGASLVFRGIEGAVPLLHGSQGCATYIRRYLISHFKEPVDIASSNFSESSTIFGGGANLKQALQNVISQYRPALIGIATTCLSETIGDDVRLILDEFKREYGAPGRPVLVTVSTPSYQGSHIDGFHDAVQAVIQQVASGGPKKSMVTIFPGMVSAADLRLLKEILIDFGLDFLMLPDYSETMDGVIWDTYQIIAPGGAPVSKIRAAGRSKAALQLGRCIRRQQNAAEYLAERFGVEGYTLGLPVGIKETDRLMQTLAILAGRDIPRKYQEERGRLIDAYVDAHKYLYGKKAAVYGEPDLVLGMASFLAEVGMVPAICATGSKSGKLAEELRKLLPESEEGMTEVAEGVDFEDIRMLIERVRPDVLIGNSKGYPLARRYGIPLIRVGFPIHDRIGGPRLLYMGYRGTQQLFDRIVNALIRARQDQSPIGWSYI